MNTIANLEQQMKQDKPKLSILVNQSFIKTKKGYIGFMITRGVWYKLRVYDPAVNGFNMKIYETFTYEAAELIIEGIKQQNQMHN